MTYEQAIQFWYGRINYEQRAPKPSDLKLERMRALLALLGQPHRALRIVHVAGSKGKGSTSAMLAGILQRAGYRTGLFTSPHLCRVEERIQVNGTPIRAEELAALMADVRPYVERLDARREPGSAGVTFFEVATALGFLHFQRRRVEAAVVEVGLGGRFDSTNVCDPLLAVITSISFDHTQQLGNTLASIAREKAGIIKPFRPALSGATVAEARQVIERISRQRQAPLRQLGVDVHYRHEPGRITADATRLPRVEVQTARRRWPVLEVGLFGEHQAANAALAVAAVETLRDAGLVIPDTSVAQGLREVYWPARLEVVQRRPLVLLDCAHNVASADALVEMLQHSILATGSGDGNGEGRCIPRRLLIFAGSGDKDIAGMFQVLAPHFTAAIFTRFSTNPRSVPPEKLAALWQRCSVAPWTTHASAADAWQAARAEAGEADLICITGSVFLAGELRPLLAANSRSPCDP